MIVIRSVEVMDDQSQTNNYDFPFSVDRTTLLVVVTDNSCRISQELWFLLAAAMMFTTKIRWCPTIDPRSRMSMERRISYTDSLMMAWISNKFLATSRRSTCEHASDASIRSCDRQNLIRAIRTKDRHRQRDSFFHGNYFSRPAPNLYVASSTTSLEVVLLQ
jgi:hypothetical protein